MILLIDNYDSFTYNLEQLVGSFNHNIIVKRNDEMKVEEVEKCPFPILSFLLDQAIPEMPEYVKSSYIR